MWVATCFDRVWRYAHALTHDPVAAEDVVQDTFLAALSSPSGPREADPLPWLLAIARNRWARQHRRRVGQPNQLAPLEAVDRAEPGDLAALGVAAGWGEDPERAAAAAEDRARLHAALARLSPEDREILWLRDGEGLDGPATAALLGLGLEASKSRLHRARLRLMAALRDGEDHGD